MERYIDTIVERCFNGSPATDEDIQKGMKEYGPMFKIWVAMCAETKELIKAVNKENESLSSRLKMETIVFTALIIVLIVTNQIGFRM